MANDSKKRQEAGTKEIEVPDANFYLQVAGDHLEEAEIAKRTGKQREMDWQCWCARNALSMAIQYLKAEPDTKERETLFKRFQVLDREVTALLLF